MSKSLFAAGTLLVLLHAAPTRADSGYVRGRIQYYENQGNFCPSTRDCTGSLYRQNQFNTNRPVIRTKVSIVDGAGNVIGTGSTNSTNGQFLIAWSSPGTGVSGSINWFAEDVDGRFNVRSGTGGRWIFWTAGTTLTNGTTAGAPQDLGTWTWGAPGSPHQITNVYAGAQQMWWWSLYFSSRMRLYFTNVQIRAFNTTCPTSCSQDGKLINLDPAAAYAPQARVAHEMGHQASSLSAISQDFDFVTGDEYCWPSTSGSCVWSLNTPEWSSVGFEEAIATVFGDLSFYTVSATAPHTCFASSAACPTGSFNEEQSLGTLAVCNATTPNSDRLPINAIRYIWDVIDTVNEPGNDTTGGNVGSLAESLNHFPEGRDDKEEDEPWCCFFGCWVCEPDGRSSVDFYWNHRGETGLDSAAAWWNNCQPNG